MADWYMNPELHDEDYEELLALLHEDEEAEEGSNPSPPRGPLRAILAGPVRRGRSEEVSLLWPARKSLKTWPAGETFRFWRGGLIVPPPSLVLGRLPALVRDHPGHGVHVAPRFPLGAEDLGVGFHGLFHSLLAPFLVYVYIIAHFLRLVNPGGARLRERREDLLVGQLRAVKLDLNLDPVHPDIPGEVEGGRILDPGPARPPLGEDPLEVLALVVGGIRGEQVLGADQLSRGAQLRAVFGAEPDPDLPEAAALRRGAVELEVLAQLREAQLRNVQAAREPEAERVHMGGAVGLVRDAHISHVHHGGQPLSFTLHWDYTIAG